MKKVEVKLQGGYGYAQWVMHLTKDQPVENISNGELLDNKKILDYCEKGEDEMLQEIFSDIIMYEEALQILTLDSSEKVTITVDGKSGGEVQYLNPYEGGKNQPIRPIEIKNLPTNIKSNLQLIADRLNKEEDVEEGDSYPELSDDLAYVLMLEEVTEASLSKEDVYMVRTDIADIYDVTYQIEIPDEDEFDFNKLFFFADMTERVFTEADWHQIYLNGVVYDGVWYGREEDDDENYMEKYTMGSWITKSLADYEVLWYDWEEF